MLCRGSNEPWPDASKWPVVSAFPCLGHVIQDDASIRACFSNCKTLMWKAFWANCGSKTVRKAPASVKCLLLNRCCKAGLDYRCSWWPPQPAIAKELDRMQTRMMAVIMQLPRVSDETPADFVRRRNRLAASECRTIGRWSIHWYKRAVQWDNHIARNHSPTCWPMLLRDFHDDSWLLEQRAANNFHGAQTRASPGRPPMRWQEGVALARAQLPENNRGSVPSFRSSSCSFLV